MKKRLGPPHHGRTISDLMKRVKRKDTSLEMAVRCALYKNGIRGYRVNFEKLPGKPDIVFIKYRIAIFVHGCFWHSCSICNKSITKQNSSFWENKMKKNVNRDEKVTTLLQNLGYNVLVIWEHDVKNDLNLVIRSILSSLEEARSHH